MIRTIGQALALNKTSTLNCCFAATYYLSSVLYCAHFETIVETRGQMTMAASLCNEMARIQQSRESAQKVNNAVTKIEGGGGKARLGVARA
jgi:hypothetical protein